MDAAKSLTLLLGDWYICSTEYSDSSDPELYHFKEYTKENTIGFVSYTADGKGVSKSIDEEDQSVLEEVKFHWTLSNGKLTITPDGSNISTSGNVIFEGNDKYSIVMQYDTVSEKMSFKRI